MNKIGDFELNNAESIGYKSKIATLRFICVLITGICVLFICIFAIVKSPRFSAYFGMLFIPSGILLALSIKRIYNFKKAPDCIIKKNETTLFFWSKDGWKSVLLSEITKVYVGTGKYNLHHGDMIIYTENSKYTICDVEDFDEVKVRIGVYRK